jgi:hypothetical protein
MCGRLPRVGDAVEIAATSSPAKRVVASSAIHSRVYAVENRQHAQRHRPPHKGSGYAQRLRQQPVHPGCVNCARAWQRQLSGAFRSDDASTRVLRRTDESKAWTSRVNQKASAARRTILFG